MDGNDIYENELGGSTLEETKYVRGIGEAGNSTLVPVEGFGYDTATAEEIEGLFE